MINIVLYQPEIPPNTGNIIRLCANTNSILHIIEPTAFDLDTKRLRRAGLDYHDLTQVKIHESWDHFCHSNQNITKIAYSTKSNTNFDSIKYSENDYLLFGPETRGLPDQLLWNDTTTTVTIPMHASSRSINLSNAVAIGLYEALKQTNYKQF
ncbi:MAG: tRNA (cytidine(34)-2'-O)-methyltransferase [Legionellales bacterium]|jgi:tRNA (cytidine/uridine-2'-O-)-methyltransferase|nr:tRNA (cytidine(34)-2'-O)-methyltransferase [Legionellales bacterium]